jgi:hypothetical protein
MSGDSPNTTVAIQKPSSGRQRSAPGQQAAAREPLGDRRSGTNDDARFDVGEQLQRINFVRGRHREEHHDDRKCKNVIDAALDVERVGAAGIASARGRGSPGRAPDPSAPPLHRATVLPPSQPDDDA